MIADSTLVAAATSDRYITSRSCPSKAINLVDEAGLRARAVEIDSSPVGVDDSRRAVTAGGGETGPRQGDRPPPRRRLDLAATSPTRRRSCGLTARSAEQPSTASASWKEKLDELRATTCPARR